MDVHDEHGAMSFLQRGSVATVRSRGITSLVTRPYCKGLETENSTLAVGTGSIDQNTSTDTPAVHIPASVSVHY